VFEPGLALAAGVLRDLLSLFKVGQRELITTTGLDKGRTDDYRIDEFFNRR
jgi:hypothetical protein